MTPYLEAIPPGKSIVPPAASLIVMLGNASPIPSFFDIVSPSVCPGSSAMLPIFQSYGNVFFRDLRLMREAIPQALKPCGQAAPIRAQIPIADTGRRIERQSCLIFRNPHEQCPHVVFESQ